MNQTMKKSEFKTSLLNVRNTLNTVQVSGRDNLDHLLASIMILERLSAAVDTLEDDEPIRVELLEEADQQKEK